MRIGKIPILAWRQANISAWQEYGAIAPIRQHDVADFSDLQRRRIFVANAQYIVNAMLNPAKANTFKDDILVSDQSGHALRRPRDFVDRIAEVDHVIDYQYWGSNDYRNARVVSKSENLGALPRPGINDFEVVCYVDINLSNKSVRRRTSVHGFRTDTGPILAKGQTLTLPILQWLLDYADGEYRSATDRAIRPRHRWDNNRYTHGLTAISAMHDDDFSAIYYNFMVR